jgi:hypothetical protein
MSTKKAVKAIAKIVNSSNHMNYGKYKDIFENYKFFYKNKYFFQKYLIMM